MSVISTILVALASSSAVTTEAPSATRPLIAPPEAWVSQATIPAAPAAAAGAATIELLSDTQAHFTATGDTTYTASIYKIASAQGLDEGALQISWDPALETLTLHRYRILRDGKSVDLLGDGSKLSIVQREKNMENAALDGRLTVSLQPEDLRVGDVIDLAYSRTRRDPVMGGRSETVLGPRDGVSYGRVRVRILWPRSKKMEWRAAAGVIQPKLMHSAEGSELLTDIVNVTPKRGPQGAPSRFGLVNAVEVTEFPDWASISRTFAPYYDKAEQLSASSPVKAEAARIAAVTSDPKVRAEMALRLVQDQVRYLFLGMDDGGYVPASADLTWSRRFGDCKAKTVLLVALLNALGIEARPVLMDTEQGDFLASRLPFMGAFDHAIVEAKIGGRSYWLDGTRSGDSRLDWLRTPNYRVGLPIVAGGAGLEPLVPEPFDQPSETTSLALDARGGLDIPAPATGEMRFRGESAASMRRKYTDLSQADRDTAFRKLWHDTYDFVTPTTVAMHDDPVNGDFVLAISGTAKMDWFKEAGTRWYEVDRARLGWKFDTVRDGELNTDAPFAFDYPDWWASKETIQLPNGGRDFRLQGDPIDRTIGGLDAFHRTVAIKDDMLTMAVDTRALAAELPAAEVEETRTQMAALAQQGVYVRVPEAYEQTDQELAALKGDKSALAEAYLRRGALRADRKDFDPALSDEDAALAIDPNLAFAHSVRALVLAQEGDARANIAADRAIALDGKQGLAWRAKGILALSQQQWTEAVRSFTAALAVNAKDEHALAGRAVAQLALGHAAEALAGFDAALAIDPTLPVRGTRAQALAAMGRGEEAMAEADRAVAAQPQDIAARAFRADIRTRFGKIEDARADLDILIAQKPVAGFYSARAKLWPSTDKVHRQADIDAALKLDPNNFVALTTRANDAIDAGAFSKAAADLDAVSKIRPDSTAVRALRIQLLVKQGLPAEALRLADAAVAKDTKDATALNERCWLKATTNVQLETALADCDAAVKLAPDNAAILDSRGFVKLRTGAIDAAIDDYDAALRLSPNLAASLYGRGIAHARRGEQAAANADLARARTLSPDIDRRFADYGVSAPKGLASPSAAVNGVLGDTAERRITAGYPAREGGEGSGWAWHQGAAAVPLYFATLPVIAHSCERCIWTKSVMHRSCFPGDLTDHGFFEARARRI